MTIELYIFPPSPRAFKVMAVANHLGIETKLHFVDLGVLLLFSAAPSRGGTPRIPTAAQQFEVPRLWSLRIPSAVP
jgi:hypothetical protein